MTCRRHWPAACAQCLLLAWLSVSCARAQEALPDLAVFADAAGRETIAAVAAAPERFRALPRGLAAGYTRDVNWLRFSLPPQEQDEWWLEVQPPYLDDLRLYTPRPGRPGEFIEHRAGDLLPFAAREYPYRGFVFRLPSLAQDAGTVYMRLQTTSSSVAALRLWQPREFEPAMQREYAVLGAYYGMVLVVFIFHLVYWLWLRTPLRGLYLLYLAASESLFLANNGLIAQFLLPSWPEFTDASVGVATFATMSTAGIFYRHILKVDRTMPGFNVLYLGQALLPLLLLPSVWLDFYPEAARWAVSYSLLMTVVGLYLSGRLWRQRDVGAAALFGACVFSILGIGASLLQVLGLIEANAWSLNGAQIGSLGTVIMLHLAVTSRVRQMGVERREAILRATLAEHQTERERSARREQSQFVAMLSHELKTPLAVIDTAVQSLRRLVGSALPEVVQRHERIQRNVRRIDALLEQFLQQDRLDSETLTPECGDVDPNSVVRQVVARNEEQAHRLEFVAVATPHITADAELLDLAISNLVDNALKYAPADSPINLVVRAAPGSSEAANPPANLRPGVAIEVTDHGPGLPAEVRDRMFGKYVRGRQDGHVPGAGLGLYLVARIVQLHGGSVTAVASAGGGSCFRLWLPLEAREEPGT